MAQLDNYLELPDLHSHHHYFNADPLDNELAEVDADEADEHGLSLT